MGTGLGERGYGPRYVNGHGAIRVRAWGCVREVLGIGV